MFTERHYHLDHEMMKWFLLVALSVVLVLVVARRTSGVSTQVETMTDRARNAAVSDDPASLQPAIRRNARSGGVAPTARRIWNVLELHESDRFEQAINGWEDLSLLSSEKPWRSVSVATAYLRMGDLDSAECVLREACAQQLDNAVTHHLLGVVYFTRAEVANQFGKTYFAEQLRGFARAEFEKSDATATHVDLNERLGLQMTKLVKIERHETIFPELLLPPRTPTVGDLLTVLDLEDFATKSRIALAQICMEEGQFTEAEVYLDAVAESGAPAGELYMELGKAYEANGQHMHAVRAFTKAMKGNKGMTVSAVKAVENFRRSFHLDSVAPIEESIP